MKRYAQHASLCSLAFLLFLITVLLCTEVYRYSRNTLVENGRWVSSKPLLDLTPMGSGHFLLTRNALHRNRLNLQAWHGYNEVILNRVFELGTLEAALELDRASHLSVIFNRVPSGYDGIRLSRDEDLETVLFHADRLGHFTRKYVLESPQLADGWHQLKLDFADGRLAATLDDRNLPVPFVSPLRNQFVGFRSGGRAALVDRVVVKAADGSTVVAEDFRNRHPPLGQIVRRAAVWGIVAFAVVWPASLYMRRGLQFLRGFVLLQFVLFLVICLYHGFDFWFWSKRYPYEVFTPRGHVGSSLPVAFERLRSGFFGVGFTDDTGRARVRELAPHPLIARSTTAWDLKERSPTHLAFVLRSGDGLEASFVARDRPEEWPAKADNEVRVAFVGTSQTFGEGAEVLQDCLAARTHGELAATLADAAELVTFDFAIHGSRSTELLDMYEKYWIRTEPDLVVINLSHNDADPESLAQNLHRFIALSRENEIGTVLVVEPTSVRGGMRKRQAVKRVGEEAGVPVLDLHAYMNSDGIRDSGFLWWDVVHMTSLGQREAASWLAEQLRPLLAKQAEDAASS